MVKVPNSTKSKTKGKTLSWDPKEGSQSSKNFEENTSNCGKQGHKLANCRLPKRNKPKEANVIDNITKDVFDIDFTVVIFEVNLVGSNPKE